MRKIAMLMCLFICGLQGYSQIYLPVNPTVYGEKSNRSKPLLVQHLPEKDGLQRNTEDTSAQIFMNKVDNKLYGWTNHRGYFIIEGTGTPVDTTNKWVNTIDTSGGNLIVCKGGTCHSYPLASGLKSVTDLNNHFTAGFVLDDDATASPIAELFNDGGYGYFVVHNPENTLSSYLSLSNGIGIQDINNGLSHSIYQGGFLFTSSIGDNYLQYDSSFSTRAKGKQTLVIPDIRPSSALTTTMTTDTLATNSYVRNHSGGASAPTPTLQKSFDVDPDAIPQIDVEGKWFQLLNAGRFDVQVGTNINGSQIYMRDGYGTFASHIGNVSNSINVGSSDYNGAALASENQDGIVNKKSVLSVSNDRTTLYNITSTGEDPEVNDTSYFEIKLPPQRAAADSVWGAINNTLVKIPYTASTTPVIGDTLGFSSEFKIDSTLHKRIVNPNISYSKYQADSSGYLASIGLRLLKTDTAAAFLPLWNSLNSHSTSIASNTSSILLKLNKTDTTSMLSTLWAALNSHSASINTNTSNISSNTTAIALKLNKSDTAFMLSTYQRSINAFDKSIANTFGTGAMQTFQGDATNAGIRLGGVTANPSSTLGGQIIYRSDDGTIRFYDSFTGTWRQVANLQGAQTFLNKTLTSPVITTPTGIVKGDVGLGNVDNTSDVNKPISTAQAAADALKLNISASAYTLRANNTNATANVTDFTFRDVAEQTLTSGGTFSFTGTTAPSGAETHKYTWSQIGKTVTLIITCVWASPGTSVTVVNIPMGLMTDIPTPAIPSNLPSAADNLYFGSGRIVQTTSQVSSGSNMGWSEIRRNVAGTGFEIAIGGTGVSIRGAMATIIYKAQ